MSNEIEIEQRCRGLSCKKIKDCKRYDKDSKNDFHNHVCQYGAPTSQCDACWHPCFRFLKKDG